MAVPTRSLRACLLCSLVQPTSAFLRDGCPNCDSLLQLKGSSDNIAELTSQVFDGLIMLAAPQASWVAKWQRLASYVSGMYAVKVVGRLPEDIVAALEEQGIRYVPRDGTEDEEAA